MAVPQQQQWTGDRSMAGAVAGIQPITDGAAVLRLMQPLTRGGLDDDATRRRLLADLCRFVGINYEAVSLMPAAAVPLAARPPLPAATVERVPGPITPGLAPRLDQTLRLLLLTGHSEKQVAPQLNLSRWT